MADLTDFRYEIRCRTDRPGSPWQIVATNRNDGRLHEVLFLDHRPDGSDIEQFIQTIEMNANA